MSLSSAHNKVSILERLLARVTHNAKSPRSAVRSIEAVAPPTAVSAPDLSRVASQREEVIVHVRPTEILSSLDAALQAGLASSEALPVAASEAPPRPSAAKASEAAHAASSTSTSLLGASEGPSRSVLTAAAEPRAAAGAADAPTEFTVSSEVIEEEWTFPSEALTDEGEAGPPAMKPSLTAAPAAAEAKPPIPVHQEVAEAPEVQPASSRRPLTPAFDRTHEAAVEDEVSQTRLAAKGAEAREGRADDLDAPTVDLQEESISDEGPTIALSALSAELPQFGGEDAPTIALQNPPAGLPPIADVLARTHKEKAQLDAPEKQAVGKPLEAPPLVPSVEKSPRSPAPATPSLSEVHFSVTPAPPPLPTVSPMPVPEPIVVEVAAQIIGRTTFHGEVADFVEAVRHPSTISTFGELLDETLKLGQ